ncbi:TolC family protein [Wukongibacter baidiensis]|uniref:TolC family protein n=1 Tax=Wukongibacter baidiensis TaxID=1723361 RepID=UPI003D7F3924
MKKKTKSIVLTAVLSLSLLGFATAESTIINSMDFQGQAIELTLDKAIEVGLEDNVTIEKSEIDIEKADVDADKLSKSIKKAKKASNSYAQEGTISNIELMKIPDLQEAFLVDNAKRNHEVTIVSLKSKIEESYFQLLQAEEMVSINKENLEITEDLYNKTKQKFDLGLVTKQEVLQSEFNVQEAENKYRASQDTVKKATMALNVELGYDVMTNIELKDELGYKDYEGTDLAEAISKALVTRNEIKASEYSYELAKLKFDAADKKYTENVFDHRDATVTLKKAEEDLKNTRKLIEMEIRVNYLDVLQKQEDIKAGEKSVELAEEALRLTKSSYDVGMSVLTDVQKAQNTLLSAKLGLSQNILDYNLAVLTLEDSTGVGRTTISGN